MTTTWSRPPIPGCGSAGRPSTQPQRDVRHEHHRLSLCASDALRVQRACEDGRAATERDSALDQLPRGWPKRSRVSRPPHRARTAAARCPELMPCRRQSVAGRQDLPRDPRTIDSTVETEPAQRGPLDVRDRHAVRHLEGDRSRHRLAGATWIVPWSRWCARRCRRSRRVGLAIAVMMMASVLVSSSPAAGQGLDRRSGRRGAGRCPATEPGPLGPGSITLGGSPARRCPLPSLRLKDEPIWAGGWPWPGDGAGAEGNGATETETILWAAADGAQPRRRGR